jgi:hypothetical protein
LGLRIERGGVESGAGAMNLKPILTLLCLLWICCSGVADEVRVSWAKSGETNIEHYRVEAVDQVGGETRCVVCDGTNGVIELEPGHSYLVRVVAVNGFGLESGTVTNFTVPNDFILMVFADGLSAGSREVLRVPMTNSAEFYYWVATQTPTGKWQMADGKWQSSETPSEVLADGAYSRPTVRASVPLPPMPGGGE